MYHATEFNYVIEGRVQNVPFRAKAQKLPDGKYQVQITRDGIVEMAGVSELPSPFDALKHVVNRTFGDDTL